MVNNNLIFVDVVTWSVIESQMSPGVRAEFDQKGWPRIRVGQKSWSTLTLYDNGDTPIIFVSGGEDAEKEYYQELKEKQ